MVCAGGMLLNEFRTAARTPVRRGIIQPLSHLARTPANRHARTARKRAARRCTRDREGSSARSPRRATVECSGRCGATTPLRAAAVSVGFRADLPSPDLADELGWRARRGRAAGIELQLLGVLSHDRRYLDQHKPLEDAAHEEVPFAFPSPFRGAHTTLRFAHTHTHRHRRRHRHRHRHTN